MIAESGFKKIPLKESVVGVQGKRCTTFHMFEECCEHNCSLNQDEAL